MRPLRLALCLLVLALPACGEDRPQAPEDAAGARYDADGRLVGAPAPGAQKRPNLVLIVIDTLRADALRAAPGPMPVLGTLAAKGVRFDAAVAPAPWTVPSMTSLLTGLLPSAHGCDAPNQAPRLVSAVTTFAEVLRGTYGYQTAAYMAGPWFGAQESVLQGFDRQVPHFALRGAKEILRPFVEGRDPARPFFLLLHSYEAHDPYGAANHPWPEPPAQPRDVAALDEPWAQTRAFLLERNERMALLSRHGTSLHRRIARYMHTGFAAQPRPELAAELRTAYEDGVRSVDGWIGETVAQLEAWGLLENTILVVTSDHGEAFGEHGTLGHGRQLYGELVHVPLVWRGPAPFDGGRTVGGSVGLVDVLPTFLDFAGCVALPHTQGRSFLPLLRGQGAGRPVFAEETLDRENTGDDVSVVLTAVRSQSWAYLIAFDRLRGTVVERAYDLASDPGETRDLCSGTGRLDGLTFDAAFCTAVEAARDRLWGAASRGERLHATPYGGGSAQVTSERPAPCR